RRLPPEEIIRRRAEREERKRAALAAQQATRPGASPEPEKEQKKCEQADPPDPVYTPDMFKFVVTIQDDKEGLGGGSQKATAKLQFVRRKPPGDSDTKDACMLESWICPIAVDIPLRTHKETISAFLAAELSAVAATQAAKQTKRMPLEPEADYC